MSAVHVRDVGLGSASDGAVFDYAATERRVVVTADLDFGDIVARAGRARVGVVLLRLRNPSPLRSLARITSVLPPVADVLFRGALVVVSEHQIRIRTLEV